MIADSEGTELAHAEAAYLEAFKSAQELWTMLLAKREDPTVYSLEVTDARDRLVFVLPFAEVLQTARRGAGLSDLRALDRARRLRSRTQELRSALAREIDATRQTVEETRALMGRLHQPADGE